MYSSWQLLPPDVGSYKCFRRKQKCKRVKIRCKSAVRMCGKIFLLFFFPYFFFPYAFPVSLRCDIHVSYLELRREQRQRKGVLISLSIRNVLFLCLWTRFQALWILNLRLYTPVVPQSLCFGCQTDNTTVSLPVSEVITLALDNACAFSGSPNRKGSVMEILCLANWMSQLQ